MSRTVLVVDDEAAVCQAITRALVRQGYQVTSFVSGGLALAHLASGPRYAVVLLDVHLVDMDASRFLARLRDIAADQVDRCVLMTGHEMVPPECSPLPLLEKPWTMQELIETVAKAAAKPR
jgi:CheY-like chemotaxis protein